MYSGQKLRICLKSSFVKKSRGSNRAKSAVRQRLPNKLFGTGRHDKGIAVLKLLSIQYLRGIAALFIVFFHLFVQLARLGYTGLVPNFLNAGVDIFFVISGFIMWHTTFNKNIGTLEFLRHRVIRIVPLYWLMTTFYLAILLIRPSWMQSTKFELSHIVASYLFIPAVHPSVTKLMWPLVVPGWTLNYEMFFYLFFGLALFFKDRARAVIVIAMLICIVGMQAFDPPVNSIIGFYSSSIILEFALGVALGYLCTRGVSIPRLASTLMMLAGFIGLVTGLAADLSDLPRVFTFGIPAFLIVAGAVFYERAHNLVEIRLPKLLGDASYSLYLSHGAVLSAFGLLWRELSLPLMSKPIFLVLFSLSAVITATIIGIGLYRFVERPLLHSLSVRIKPA